jgi:hypothetical protein
MNKYALLPENAELLFQEKLISHRIYRDIKLREMYQELHKKMKREAAIEALTEIVWKDEGGKGYCLSYDTVLKIVLHRVEIKVKKKCLQG